jgi:Asp/Glu/hydantoin racemase
MGLIQVQVNVEQNTLQVGQAFIQFAAAVKAAIKAGNPLSEGIAIGTAALTNIVPILSQLNQVPVDATSDPVAEAMTSAVLGQQLYTALTGKS